MDEAIEALKRARVMHQLKPQEAEKEYKSIIAQGSCLSSSPPVSDVLLCLHSCVGGFSACMMN